MIYLLISNVVSFFLYWIDKKKAIKDEYRIPELCLLLVSTVGPFGALFAMKKFNHKTKKIIFQIWNSLCSLIHVIIILKMLKVGILFL